jgi:hypothetical protein
MNLQLYGDFQKKVHYSIVVGKGVHSGKFEDAIGNKALTIIQQSPMVGMKLVASPSVAGKK